MQNTNINTNIRNKSENPVLPKQNPHYSVMIERIVKIVLIVTAILAVVFLVAALCTLGAGITPIILGAVSAVFALPGFCAAIFSLIGCFMNCALARSLTI